MTKSLFLAVLFCAATINTSEHQAAYLDGSQHCATPKAPTPSPKQETKDAKSAPNTPRPNK